MNKDLQNIEAIKSKIEGLERDDIEAKALQKQVLKDLKERFSLNSIEEAEAYVEKAKKKLIKNKAKLEEEYNEFISKFGEQLGLN